MRIAVRTRNVNDFSRSLSWCCGVAIADADDEGARSFDGELVNVCLQTAETSGVGDDMHAFTRELRRVLNESEAGSLLVVQLACECREVGRNKRGALVLHAVEYLSVSVVASPELEDELDDRNCHKEDKTQRHAIFAAWLVETFGALLLASGRGVVDVAAGKGLLSAELGALCGDDLPRTLVEPVAREASANAGGLVWLLEKFDAVDFPAAHSDLVDGCSVFVGLHPDQPTEAIVDCALQRGKPFAVVPCCVYPGLFPDRRQSTGQGVATYGGFLRYLRSKDARIKTARLPFLGRNTVLYVDSSGD